MKRKRNTHPNIMIFLISVGLLLAGCNSSIEDQSQNKATTEPVPLATAAVEETLPTMEPIDLQNPDLPFIMNRGAPANERCVVTNPQALDIVVNVYAEPDLQSVLVAQMGNWADVLQIEDGWYKVLIPQGGTGWVQVEQVTLGGDCSSK